MTSGPVPSDAACFYACGRPATTWDHFIPRRLYKPRDKRARFALPTGAWHSAPPSGLNKVPACAPCNRSKGSLHPRDWLTCPPAGVAPLRARLAEIAAWEAQARSAPQPRVSGPSTSDGPGSWYGRPVVQPMPPPPWVAPPRCGGVRSLREHAAAYLALSRQTDTPP